MPDEEPRLRTEKLGGAHAAATSARITRHHHGLTVPALASDYVECEYLISGWARTYTGPATGPISPTGIDYPYTTRVLVRMPRDGDAAFSGRVLIEPFNTSAGPDHDALWCHIGPLLERQGDAWIGVSARACSQQQLVALNSSRYSRIDLACNDLAWDILTQVAWLARCASDASPLHGLAVHHVYLGGYSQSATDTATYASAFTEITAAFDGYFPVARGSSMTPIASGTDMILAMECAAVPACLVPVIEVQPQTDVEGFRAQLAPDKDYLNTGGAWVRRDDADEPADRYRLYEIPGAPHIGQMDGCDGASDFPLSAHIRAALHRLFQWAERAKKPPAATRILLAKFDHISIAATDDVGNAIGGVRSPFVDVPLATYHAHTGPGILCKLVGREHTLSSDTLRSRYGTADGYLQAFTRSLDASCAAGFIDADDWAELVELAKSKALKAFGAPS